MHNYSGQTEVIEQYLANHNQKAEMLFMCDKFSVLLLTRHISIKEVPFHISKEVIINKIKNLANSYKIKCSFTQDWNSDETVETLTLIYMILKSVWVAESDMTKVT